MIKVKQGLDINEVVEELACALDIVRFEIKNPGSTPEDVILSMIDLVLNMCEEIE